MWTILKSATDFLSRSVFNASNIFGINLKKNIIVKPKPSALPALPRRAFRRDVARQDWNSGVFFGMTKKTSYCTALTENPLNRLLWLAG
jgi:hypothetical protein